MTRLVPVFSSLVHSEVSAANSVQMAVFVSTLASMVTLTVLLSLLV